MMNEKKVKWIEYNPMMSEFFGNLNESLTNSTIAITGYFNGSEEVETRHVVVNIWWTGYQPKSNFNNSQSHIIPIKMHFRDGTWCYGMKLVENYATEEPRLVEHYLPYARCGKNGKPLSMDDGLIVSFKDLYNLNSAKDYKLRKFLAKNGLKVGNTSSKVYTSNPSGLHYGEIPFARKMGKQAWSRPFGDTKRDTDAILWKYINTQEEDTTVSKVETSIIPLPDVLEISCGGSVVFNNMDATMKNEDCVDYFKENN